MKRLFAVLLVLLMAAPAIAADWNFYGSARVATFYTISDRSTNDNKDIDLDHSLQGNSRVGANVKADKIEGNFELALRGNDQGDVQGGGPGGQDDGARTRKIWGKWKYADNMSLLIGKEMSILDMTEVSNQVYGGDNDLTGLAPTGFRINQVTLQVGGFQFSLAQPNTSNTETWTRDDRGIPFAGGAGVSGAISNTQTNDAKYPKLEAAYTMPLDNFVFKVGGGWQMIETSPSANGVNTGSVDDIQSYTLHAMVKAKLGALYANVAGFYGQNVVNGAWNYTGKGQVAGYSTAGFLNGDLEDSTSFGGGGEVGLNFTDTIAFAIGGGYRVDESKLARSEVEAWYNYYAQMTYKLAPGFKITPEVGYIALQDSFTTAKSGGNDIYAGLQWRIDF